MKASTETRIGFVKDHIRASFPCGMQGVINWSVDQGLDSVCGQAITAMLIDREIEIYVDEDEGRMVISPL